MSDEPNFVPPAGHKPVSVPAPARFTAETEVPVPPKPRKPRVWMWVAVALVVLLAGGGTAALLTGRGAALTRLEGTEQDLAQLLERSQQADSEYAAASAAANKTAQRATALLAIDMAGVVDPKVLDTFSVAASKLHKALSATVDPVALPTAPKVVRTDNGWTIAAAERKLHKQITAAATAVDGVQAASAALAKSEAAVESAASTLLGSVAEFSTALDAANPLATNASRFALRDAAARVATAEVDVVAPVMTAYARAAQDFLAAQATADGALNGPLRDKRLAVEQLAHRLAPGILLDFVWVPDVPAGAHVTAAPIGSVQVETSFDRGGYATITFSDRVARYYPTSDDLVAFSVGWALASHCHRQVDTSIDTSWGLWATAWATSHGYAGLNNGHTVWGDPSTTLIEAARGCS